ncbi:MAG: histidine phosphatase family protein [Planctomycetota bacterium]
MAKPDDARLILLCSGPTEWDEAGRLGGGADLPLSAAGIERTESLVAGLEGTEQIASVISGPDEASQATADLAGARLGVKVRVIDDLCEVGLGLWEGLRPEDLEERYPRVSKQWLANPAGVRVPEGEPVPEAQDRLINALLRGLDKAKCDGTNAVVVVLRPMAFSLVLAAVDPSAAGESWEQICNGPDVRKAMASRAVLKAALGQLRAAV